MEKARCRGTRDILWETGWWMVMDPIDKRDILVFIPLTACESLSFSTGGGRTTLNYPLADYIFT